MKEQEGRAITFGRHSSLFRVNEQKCDEQLATIAVQHIQCCRHFQLLPCMEEVITCSRKILMKVMLASMPTAVDLDSTSPHDKFSTKCSA